MAATVIRVNWVSFMNLSQAWKYTLLRYGASGGALIRGRRHLIYVFCVECAMCIHQKVSK